MLPCDGCAYRATIPGDEHIRCLFAWEVAEVVWISDSVPRRARRWFTFPFNYDPVWGPDVCSNRAEVRDPAGVAPASPLADLLSLLGGRR